MRARTRLIRAALLTLVCLIVALLWWGARHSSRQNSTPLAVSSTPAASPIVSNTPPIASPSPAIVTPTPFGQSALPSSEAKSLLIPVAGVRPEELHDTFTEARSEGRVHDAIDIPAAHNTPVLAAADGTVVKLFQSVRGGTTIYQLDPDNKTVYYYAHLDHYAENLTEGHIARRGEVIAYVGDTGDAAPGNYHLHFSIALVADSKHFYNSTNINPYPLLRHTAP